MLKNHLCQISETPPTLESMDKNRGFPNVIFIIYFQPRCVIYTYIWIICGIRFILKWWFHLEIHQLWVIFCHFFSQNIHTPFPWQRACIWMKGVLIAWFWVTMTKIGKFQQNRWLCVAQLFKWLQRIALKGHWVYAIVIIDRLRFKGKRRNNTDM